MPSQLRQDWQAFKKAHPTFEQSKNFKSDVGPQLDKFQEGRDQYSALKQAAQQKLEGKSRDVVKIGTSVGAALKGYEAVLKELEATDKTIRADFKKMHFDSFVDAYVKPYTTKIEIKDD